MNEMTEREREQQQRWDEKCRKEIESDKKFSRWFFIIFFGFLAIGLFACEPSNEYGPGCYDADPTQYVDVICD